MPLKSLGQLEQGEAYIIFMVLIIVLLWHGVWGLVEDLETYLQAHYGIKKVYLNLLSILLAILVIGIFPQILKKL